MRIGELCFFVLIITPLRAVLIDETVMAKISSASCFSASISDDWNMPLSMSSSIQNIDSSVSSSTIPILAIKSAVDLARQADL